MRESRQFNSIVELIKSNEGQQPLHRFLQKYFRDHKQMGSRDRRLFSDWIYGYYRLGKSLTDQAIEAKITVANFLTQYTASDLLLYALAKYTSLHYDDIVKPLNYKIKLVQQHYTFNVKDIFPFSPQLMSSPTASSLLVGEDIKHLKFVEQFALSILQQPKVWIRVKKEFTAEVKSELDELDIAIEQYNDLPLAWSIPQRTKLEALKTFQQGCFEIQDISSQRTGYFFEPNENENWYDCCAASGGKSLLLHSIKPSVHLTVSDQRNSVLENLQERFKRAGIKHYQSFVCDLTNNIPDELINKQFDGIILDAPCSGSGTWARTPEQISFFQIEQIQHYQQLQRTIFKNVMPLLKSGKPLVYITCSVFREENEIQIDYFKTLGMQLEKQVLIDATTVGGDTMFVSRMIKR